MRALYLQSLQTSSAGLPPGKDRDLAIKARARMEKEMTPAEVAEARRLARVWKPKQSAKKPEPPTGPLDP